ncbi:TMEM104 [Cordylochernes scorpioides]|uniref:TMEM104 n=1 Tax=Cordylochernes scorpioides TaxID=51811 RepID=A0ABY6LGH0_9ARAC|nr:TMEM104 [Cordylochernes scorpioides]
MCSTYNNSNISDSAPCWEAFDYINRMGVYRIILVSDFLCSYCRLPPTWACRPASSWSLDLSPSLMFRRPTFAMMIILALIILIPGEGQGHPSKTNLKGIPQLFGVSVYSFMCHHSVPSLIAPIRKKRLLNFYIALDYVVILTFYLLLSLTAVFTFPEIFNIYTLNFKVNPNFHHPVLDIPFIQYFLALFPVFTLSANFPIISITLCNNLKSLILNENKPHSFFLNRIAFPLLSLIPPLLICMVTNNLSMLVGYTGSYAGAGVQYVIPALLVYRARKDSLQLLGLGVHNKHASPFWHNGWIVFVLIWTVICIVLVTIHHIYTGS